MNLLPGIFGTGGKGLLNEPGDTFIAKITKNGFQVIKIIAKGGARTFTRYPSTGTVVETIVYKDKQ